MYGNIIHLLAVFFHSFFAQPHSIHSNAMFPTLMQDDYIIADKTAYGYSQYSFSFPMPLKGKIFETSPQRGDIVIFMHVKGQKRTFVKRVIGLPGEVIEMNQGTFYINNIPVRRKKIKKLYRERQNHKKFLMDQYQETLPNNITYKTIELSAEISKNTFLPLRNTEKLIIPKDHFFVMGDNRDFSVDSRNQEYMGFIHKDKIIGKVSLLYFSLNKNRFFS